MKRSSIAGAAALLVLSSSVAFGLALRHMEYDAKVAGTDGSKLMGSATMKSTADDKGTDIDFKLTGDAASLPAHHVLLPIATTAEPRSNHAARRSQSFIF